MKIQVLHTIKGIRAETVLDCPDEIEIKNEYDSYSGAVIGNDHVDSWLRFCINIYCEDWWSLEPRK